MSTTLHLGRFINLPSIQATHYYLIRGNGVWAKGRNFKEAVQVFREYGGRLSKGRVSIYDVPFDAKIVDGLITSHVSDNIVYLGDY